MKITYDAEADAMYIYLQGTPGDTVHHTEVIGGGIAVDYGPGGTVFGIEILNASETLHFPRGCPEVSLEQMVFKGAPAR
jgi:uncharacterized protein YuzE